MEQEGHETPAEFIFQIDCILFLFVFAFLLFGDKVVGMNSYGAGSRRDHFLRNNF